MDPLVKAHLRIAALEQQLKDPERIKVQMGSSFAAHYLRVVPLPGDIILCAEMDEPKDVFHVALSTAEGDEGRTEFDGRIVSGTGWDSNPHTCRPSTCMFTIRILRRSRGDFEQSLLRAEFGIGKE